MGIFALKVQLENQQFHTPAPPTVPGVGDRHTDGNTDRRTHCGGIKGPMLPTSGGGAGVWWGQGGGCEIADF